MGSMAGIWPRGWWARSRPLLIGIFSGALLGLGLGWFGLIFGLGVGGLIGEVAHRIFGVTQLEELLGGNRNLSARQALWALGASSVLIGASKNHFTITQNQLDLFGVFLTQLDPELSRSKVNQLKQNLAEFFHGSGKSMASMTIPSPRELLTYVNLAKQREPTDTLLVWMYHLGSATELGANYHWIDWLVSVEKKEDFLTHARLTWYPNHQALATLDLGYPCSFDQVKTSYRKILLQVHPDHTQGQGSNIPSTSDAFLEIQEAYKLLEWQRTLPGSKTETTENPQDTHKFSRAWEIW